MSAFPLPAKGQIAVYETELGVVHVEYIAEGRERWFGLENITRGMSYLPRNRPETKAWLTRHGGIFLHLE